MMKNTWKRLTIMSMFFLICIVLAFSMVAVKANAAGLDSYDPVTNDHGINSKVSTAEDRAASVAAAHEFNVDVEAEGIVLMKNEDNALPLKKGSDVSLFGKNSHHIVYGGTGSSSTGGLYGQRYLSWYARGLSGSTKYSTATATSDGNESKIEVADGGELTQAGLNVNKELSNYYSSFRRSGVTKNTAVGANDPPTDFSTREPSLTKFKEDTKVVDSYATHYRDAAIMTISRIGGEGFDMPRQLTNTGSSVGATVAVATLDTAAVIATTADVAGSKKAYSNSNWADGDKYHHALEPEMQELDMAEYIKTPTAQGGAGFDKLILLVNTGTPMELGALEEYADAIVWIGFPGASGLTAVAQTLVGDINPSGRFVDTWAKDLIKTPSVQDFGSNLIINEDRDALVTGANVYGYTASSGTAGNGGASVRYQEGIYVGYRYYETRGFAELQEDADSTWYEDDVAYPFGYGLSYSSGFTWELTSGPTEGSTISKDGTLSFTVRVTNNESAYGGVAGKDVVQLYYSAPYFDNGIEKSHVVLGGYAKTGIIKPGGYADVTIKMDVNDLASYDWNDANGNDFMGYEVEAGDYTFYLAKDAHGWADPATLQRTVKVANSDADFDEEAIKGKNGFAVKTSATGYTIENQFDDISKGWLGGAYATEANAKAYGWSGFGTMSRNNFTGTFPRTPTSDDLKLDNNTAPTNCTNTSAINFVVNAAYDTNISGAREKKWIADEEPTGNNGNTTNPAVQQEIVLADLVGVDKGDDLWDDYLDQFSFPQLASVLQGFYMAGGNNAAYSATNNMPNLGLSANWSPDGPTGITATSSSGFSIGSTNSCYYLSPIVMASTWNVNLAEKLGASIGNEALVIGCVAIYAPAMNTHRNPFSGRNFEYLSEDGFMAGTMASAVVKGMQSKGLIPNIKHFALNDQDTDRDTVGGLYTWATEQAMREIYLKAYQIPVEEGKALGVMSAFSRVGATPASDSYPLLTEVLRNEWGFEGYVVTDWYGSGQTATGKGWTNMIAGIRAGNDMILGSYSSSGLTALNPSTTQETASSSTGYRNTQIAAVRKAAHNVLFTLTRSNAVFRSYAGLVQTIVDPSNVKIDVSSNKALYWNSQYNVAAFKISYSLSEGSTLPAGYKLNSSTGIITGSAANFESFKVNIDTMVTTTGLVGTWRYATMEYTVNSGLSASEVPVLDFADETYTGTVGSMFTASTNTMTVSTGQSVQSRIIDGTLPAGLRIDSNGLIYGIPTAAGTSTITVESEINGAFAQTAVITIIISNAGSGSEFDDSDLWAAINDILDKIDDIESDVTGIKADIADILADILSIQSDIASIQTDISGLATTAALTNLVNRVAVLEGMSGGGTSDLTALYTYIDGLIAGLEDEIENIALTPGPDGKSAYDLAVDGGFEGTVTEWIASLKGATGATGVAGTVITIGSNGNWYIDGVDTLVAAAGTKGDSGAAGSVITIGTNGNWYIDGVDTLVAATGGKGDTGATGAAGSVITIGTNGNWYIDGVDTTVSATGASGIAGSVITVGTNGNWYIDGIDTAVSATGPAGTNGTNGTNGTDGKDGVDGSGCNSVVGVGMGAALGLIMLAGAAVLILKKRREDSSK